MSQREQPGRDPLANKFFGKYRGVVSDNRDPERRGRLSVQVPQVLHEARVWAMPCVPYAGPEGLGFYAMPEVGTGVWVEFEAGDPSFPIWTGCFWPRRAIPEADANPEIKFFRTKKFRLRVDDSVGEIVMENDQESRITITATHVIIKSSTVQTEGSGGKKTRLDAVSFNVNDGAWEVL